MRTWLAVVASVLIVALGLSACAGPPRPVVLDTEANGRLTVEGFREASEVVSARLETALAWAVFPDVEDTAEECVHEGRLFRSGAAPRPVRLRCAAGPAAPAGVASSTALRPSCRRTRTDEVIRARAAGLLAAAVK